MVTTKLLSLSALLLCSLLGSHAQGDIILGSTLTAGANSSWRSPSGDFAFGFHPLTGGLFLLGIWFDQIPERTLVWSANRDIPSPAGSTVSLTLTGQLVLTHPNRTAYPIYRSDAVNSASMENNGNFVLKSSTSQFLWQSFDNPTDTILPDQILVKGQKLYSNANGTVDFSIGRFMLEMEEKGNVVLSAFHYVEKGYWSTNTDLQENVRLVFNQSTAQMYVVNSSATIIRMTSDVPIPIDDYYHRATVEDTGNFVQYVYPKVNGNGWTSVWSAVTEPCFVNGICGVYGFCASADNRTATCSCLPGYSPMDPNIPSKGCYPDIPPEQCSRTESPVTYTIEVIDDADFANDVFTDLGRIFDPSLENCKQAILDDCFCMAAALNVTTCLKKRIPFMNARRSHPYTTGMRALIKVPVRTNLPQKAKGSSRTVLKVGLFTSIFFALSFAAIAIYYHPKTRGCRFRKPFSSANTEEINLKRFTFQELYEATDGFCNKIGRGAFGTVYNGALILEDKQIEIAVKKLEKMVEQGEKEFLTEVRVIGQTHHKNLVNLLGYCNEQNHRLLVYELMKHGSVSGFLFGEEEKPSWDSRVQIVLGIARGLLYLHEECETQIIHCDIKPQNVLLDKHYTAKIADFGLAKLLMKDQTRTSTNVRGTMGYMAPEWLKSAPITAKVDVYSFGVMLLEIICCRKHIELNKIEEEIDENNQILTDWVVNCVRQGKLEMVVKHEAEVLNDFERFERMALVGLWCIHPNPILRPAMKKVMQMLEGTIEVGDPPLVYSQSM